MLRELSVQNLALIEDVRVELQPGFCAWTGETGAGKSLLLGALGLLLGERGSAELLRTGAEELRITGRFELTSPELKRESESLLQPAYQLQLLDAYGQLEQSRQKYLDLAAQVRELRREWKTLSTQ